MKKNDRFAMGATLLASALVLVGCDAFEGVLDVLGGARVTTLELRNNGDFPVEVRFFFDDNQETLDGLIQLTGSERNFVVDAGSTRMFSRPCDELQAVIIDDADLRVFGGIGPEDRTDLYRDGSDFGCGDTIVFTFDHSDLFTDFAIRVTVIPN